MAETLWLLKRVRGNRGGSSHINGVQAMILNADDAQTLAQNNVTAQAILNSPDVYGGGFPPQYFEEQQNIGDLSGGYMKDPGDAVVFGPHNVFKVEGE